MIIAPFLPLKNSRQKAVKTLQQCHAPCGSLNFANSNLCMVARPFGTDFSRKRSKTFKATHNQNGIIKKKKSAKTATTNKDGIIITSASTSNVLKGKYEEAKQVDKVFPVKKTTQVGSQGNDTVKKEKSFAKKAKRPLRTLFDY